MPDARKFYPQAGVARTARGAHKKGYRMEKALADELDKYVPGTSRPRAGQPLDEGDLLIPGEFRYIIQSKNVSNINLKGTLAAAAQQGKNKQARWGLEETPVGVVVWKRPRALVTQARLQYVTIYSWESDRIVPAGVEIAPLPSARAVHMQLSQAFTVWPNGIFAGNRSGRHEGYTYMLFGRFLDLMYPAPELPG